jgi:hypothetical protein
MTKTHFTVAKPRSSHGQRRQVDGEPTHVNKTILDYSGMRLEEFLNLGLKEFSHPDDFEKTANAFYHAIRTSKSRSTHGNCLRPSAPNCKDRAASHDHCVTERI